MNLSGRFTDALHEMFDEGCPVLRDPDTGRRCGRHRYARRRCFACAEMAAKPLALAAEYAAQYGMSLAGAFLEEARLAGGELRWVNLRHARLSGASLAGADVRGADFSRADISSADFRGADLTNARFRFVRKLSGARFDGAVLEGSVFLTAPGAAASGTSFAHADLTKANFSHAELPGANFGGARLVGADFRESVLAGADFAGADLADADLAGADLTGAGFEGARLENVRLAANRSVEGLQTRAHEPGLEAAVLAECMRAFVGVRASSDRTRLRVLARKVPRLSREDALDIVLPILEREDVAESYAEEAVAALRSLGRDPSTRPFLIGLLSRGAEKVRLEAASILAEPPLDGETRRLFHSILTSPAPGSQGAEEEREAHRSFRRGVFRALAPGVEDGDAESVELARSLLLTGELFDGELIAALGQSGSADGDESYRRQVEQIALDRAQSQAARLAAARELAERFFGEETCARLEELLGSAESDRFRRNAFWFVARRVTDGDEAAARLARKLLAAGDVLEPDIRWALAESGDTEQAGYFADIVARGAREGWRQEGAGEGEAAGPVGTATVPGRRGPARYDDLVRAAQVLGKIGTPEAVEPLAELIRRDQGAGGGPAGSPFSLTEAAREAILAIRGLHGLVPAEEETSLEVTAAEEATVVEPVDSGPVDSGEETRVEAVGEEAVVEPVDAVEETRVEPAAEAGASFDVMGNVMGADQETVVEPVDAFAAGAPGGGGGFAAPPGKETVAEPSGEETVADVAGEETHVEPADERIGIEPVPEGAAGLSPDEVFGPRAARGDEAQAVTGEEGSMPGEDRREEGGRPAPEEEAREEAEPREAAEVEAVSPSVGAPAGEPDREAAEAEAPSVGAFVQEAGAEAVEAEAPSIGAFVQEAGPEAAEEPAEEAPPAEAAPVVPQEIEEAAPEPVAVAAVPAAEEAAPAKKPAAKKARKKAAKKKGAKKAGKKAKKKVKKKPKKKAAKKKAKKSKKR